MANPKIAPPPPVNQLPFVDIKGGVGYLSHFALDFLTKLWNQTQLALLLPLYGMPSIGMPGASQILGAWAMTGDETFAQGFPNNVGSVGTAPTADAIFPIEVNGVQIGEATVAAGTTTMVWSLPLEYDAAAGDVLTFLAPASPDATLADVYFTFVAVAV